MFPSHIDPSSLLLEIKKGKYFMGYLQVSRFDITEATVKIKGVNNDVLIKGKINLNRGLNMDTVAVEILPESEWIEKGMNTEAIVTDILEKEQVEEIKQESDNESENEEVLNIVERINQSDKQPMGRVVGVVQGAANPNNPHNKTYAGSTIPFADLSEKDKEQLKHLDTEEFGKSYRVFVPFDVRMEKIIIKSNRADFFDDKRIIVKIDGWSETLPFPYGHVVRVVGEKNDSKTESAVILHEFNIDTRPFSKKVLACLPQEGDQWNITAEEESKRLDLRGLNI